MSTLVIRGNLWGFLGASWLLASVSEACPGCFLDARGCLKTISGLAWAFPHCFCYAHARFGHLLGRLSPFHGRCPRSFTISLGGCLQILYHNILYLFPCVLPEYNFYVPLGCSPHFLTCLQPGTQNNQGSHRQRQHRHRPSSKMLEKSWAVVEHLVVLGSTTVIFNSVQT